MTNLDKFFNIYQVKLESAIRSEPATYGFGDGSQDSDYVGYAKVVSERMRLAALKATFNHDSPSFS